MVNKLLFCLLLLVTTNVSAQSMSVEEIQKQINLIKLSESAVYAEVIDFISNDSSNADIYALRKNSVNLLNTYVVDYFVEAIQLNKSAIQALCDSVIANCNYLEYKKSDTYKVFTYIDKEKLNSFSAEKQIFAINEEKQIHGYYNELFQEIENTTEKNIQINSVDSITKTNNDSVEIIDTTIQVPPICKEILSKKTMGEILDYLDTEKTYERLIYGNYQSMNKPTDCYVIILDKETRTIHALLDKGLTTRMNFINSKADSFNNYRGRSDLYAIFVQVF